MGEHSIEELERQVTAALDRRRAAEQAEREARQRLQEARNEDSGLVGHVVEYDYKPWNKPKGKRRLLVKNVRGSGEFVRVTGPAVTANGKVGVAKRDCYVKDLRDLGPLEAAK
jgi:hypothetical protein